MIDLSRQWIGLGGLKPLFYLDQWHTEDHYAHFTRLFQCYDFAYKQIDEDHIIYVLWQDLFQLV